MGQDVLIRTKFSPQTLISFNLALVLVHVMVGAKLLNLSVPQYSHLQMGIIILTYLL